MCKSFCLRQQRREFDLASGDALGKLLVTITLRKPKCQPSPMPGGSIYRLSGSQVQGAGRKKSSPSINFGASRSTNQGRRMEAQPWPRNVRLATKNAHISDYSD
jgi:hypothetical protein